MKGYRKVAIMALFIVTSAGLVLAGKVTGADFMTTIQVIGSAFMGANLVEHAARMKK